MRPDLRESDKRMVDPEDAHHWLEPPQLGVAACSVEAAAQSVVSVSADQSSTRSSPPHSSFWGAAAKSAPLFITCSFSALSFSPLFLLGGSGKVGSTLHRLLVLSSLILLLLNCL